MLKKQKAGGKYFGGICAAPVDVLYHHALLDGPATCYPRYSDQLGKLYRDKRVVVSGKCVTSQGPGTAMEMGLKLVELLRDTSVAKELAYSLLITK
jgi:4-methyl-5(b-hydroxyethyl)-thiazole monophosphate biosynthesis